jgi:hypothetical protein
MTAPNPKISKPENLLRQPLIGRGNELFVSRNTQQDCVYVQFNSGTSAPNLNLNSFYLLSSNTQSRKNDPLNYKLEMLQTFVGSSLDSPMALWLVRLDLVDYAFKVVLRICNFFPKHIISLRRNQNPDDAHLLEFWIEAGEDLDKALDNLNRFDVEWLLNQTEDLQKKIIILLK